MHSVSKEGVVLQDFDAIVARENTDCQQYDDRMNQFGRSDVQPMSVADMDFRAPDCVREALLRLIDHGIYGYHLKMPKYYEAIIDWLWRRHHYAVEPQSIFFTPGIVAAVSQLVWSLTKEGDGVIVQTPAYYPFVWAIEVNRRRILHNHLQETRGVYSIDFEDLETKAREARMLILCSPHNPVGRVWRRGELERVADICVRHNVTIVSDEIHNDLVYAPHQHIPIASLSPEVERITVTCHSASKTFNLASLATAYVLIKSPELRQAYKDGVAPLHVDRVNPFGLRAMEAAFTHGEAWLRELLKYLWGNYRVVCSFLEDKLPGVRVSPLEGTYLVWLDFRSWGLEDKALRERIIEKARLGLKDGPWFGPGGCGFQRMNIAYPREVVRLGLDQLSRAAGETVR
jgi:cystathionine beta-lyase